MGMAIAKTMSVLLEALLAAVGIDSVAAWLTRAPPTLLSQVVCLYV